MKIDKSEVKRILVISLSNIGDAVLTTPVIQTLLENFPQAGLAVLMGPRAFDVFRNDKRIDRKIIYDKTISWKSKLALMNRLRHNRYDLVVDLRRSVFGICLGVRYHTSIFASAPKSLTHMKDRHLWRLQSLGLDVDYTQGPTIMFGEDDRNYIDQIWNEWQIRNEEPVVAIAPGARNMTKRWEKSGFIGLIERIYSGYRAKIVMVGDGQDRPLAEEIIAQLKPRPFNLCGRTSIGQLAALLAKCSLLVACDSAPMHLSWAVNTPVIAIFGPTDYKKYAPRGQDDVVIRKSLDCSPCEQSLCPPRTRECMKLISPDEVFAACKRILNSATKSQEP